jgi:hypothetical protein
VDEQTDLDYSKASFLREKGVICLTNIWARLHKPLGGLMFAWLTVGIPQSVIDLYHWALDALIRFYLWLRWW